MAGPLNFRNIRKTHNATKPNKCLVALDRSGQRNPPVTTKSARGADDRLVKIAHFELGPAV